MTHACMGRGEAFQAQLGAALELRLEMLCLRLLLSAAQVGARLLCQLVNVCKQVYSLQTQLHHG